MRSVALVISALAMILVTGAGEAFGRGGRAGGGVSGGARAAPSPSFNRSPSMSRAAPAARPAQPAQRPAGGQVQRPSIPATGARPSTLPAMGSSQAFQRPSQGQVSNFLNMPAESGRRVGTAAAPPRPTQLPAQGGSFSKTAEGARGGQITAGGVGGVRTGPGGTTIGAGRAAVKVTGPGGNSYVRVAGGAAIRGPGGNTVAAGRGAAFVNGQFVGGRTWTAVNGSFTHWNYYGRGWYTRYPGAWWPGRWAVATAIWAPATWATAGAYCGCTAAPVYYDYSDNVTYQDGDVYYGDQPVATAEQYYDQAAQIAASGEEAQNEDWLPLGVFGVAKEGDTETEKLVQLAMNRDGLIRGNYHDLLTDKVTPLTGAVNKQTERVAIKFQGNDSVVVETGLYNLTNDEVPVLVHFGPDQQVARTLVRLQQPEEQAQE